MGRSKGSKGRTLHKWSKEELEYLKEVAPGHSYEKIFKLMNDKFEYQFSLEQIKGTMSRYKIKNGLGGHFKKGSTPWNKGLKGYMGANKTSFKKGQRSINYREVGSERINSEGYIEVKVGDPRKWQLKHRYIWEKHHGEIQPGHTIIFLDKDTTNTSIENLACVSREELLIINKNKLIKDDVELAKAGVNLSKLIASINKHERNNKGD